MSPAADDNDLPSRFTLAGRLLVVLTMVLTAATLTLYLWYVVDSLAETSGRMPPAAITRASLSRK